MIFIQRLEGGNTHFEAHRMAAFLCKIDYQFIVVDLCDASDSPCPMKHKTAFIERNMLFKIVDSFKHIPPALSQIGHLYVFFKLTVRCILFSKAFNDFLPRPVIFIIAGKYQF